MQSDFSSPVKHVAKNEAGNHKMHSLLHPTSPASWGSLVFELALDGGTIKSFKEIFTFIQYMLARNIAVHGQELKLAFYCLRFNICQEWCQVLTTYREGRSGRHEKVYPHI